MVTSKPIRDLSILLLMVVLIGGCNPSNTVRLQTPAYLTATSLPKPTNTVSFEVTLQTSSVVGQIPPKSTPTPTEKPTLPTMTVVPTLDLLGAKNLIQGFLTNNGDCRLPCLWGITPGVTALNTLEKFLMPIGEISASKKFDIHRSSHENSGGISATLWQNDIRIPVSFAYYKKNDAIHHLTLNAEASREEGEGLGQTSISVYGENYFDKMLETYLLDKILANYGIPTSVFIAPFPEEPRYPSDAKIPFSIVLYYQDQNFFIEYIVPKEKVGENIVGCPSKVGSISVIVWPPDQIYSLKGIASYNSGQGMHSSNYDYFKPIEEATQMSLDDFYQKFKDPKNTTCIETPTDLWIRQ
jgi:hypothetical protein